MKLTKAFHDIGGRKYIEVDHRRIKVPWRYNRVMGVELGSLPVQLIPEGSDVQVETVTRTWDGETHLILKKIIATSNDTRNS